MAQTKVKTSMLDSFLDEDDMASNSAAAVASQQSVKAYTDSSVRAATPGGRLTVTTGTPVVTSAVAAATTIYYTPYVNNRIALYNGSTWTTINFSELSLSLSAYTADSNYDIFCYNNSGTATLESTIWTNATTRATALALQDGIYVKSGTETRRYLGTIRINGTGGQIDYSPGGAASGGTPAVISVWNMYNRVNVIPDVRDTSNAYTYNSTTARAMNNSDGNRISMVRGLDEDGVFALNRVSVSSGSSGDILFSIALDTTSALGNSSPYISNATQSGACVAEYAGLPGLGWHYLQVIEKQASTGSAATIYTKVVTNTIPTHQFTAIVRA